ncbi:MAG: hypothetical protein JXQ73_12430 [Phycisphaerae bacterium]|nr:hypothetical protein [Phycisphaerae bacterium]
MQNDSNPTELSASLQPLIGRNVVLDTPGTIVYLGKLTELRDAGVWLEDADVHDCNEGHAGKEVYVVESAHYGIRVNRRRVFVLRGTMISISALEDVVTEISDDREYWSPVADKKTGAEEEDRSIPLE